MEIVAIERKTFEELVAKFDRFVSHLPSARRKENERVDGQSGCVPDAQHQPTHVADLA